MISSHQSLYWKVRAQYKEWIVTFIAEGASFIVIRDDLVKSGFDSFNEFNVLIDLDLIVLGPKIGL